MTTFTQLTSAPSHPAEPFTDHLRLAVAAYLARFKGSSREHTESDLRCYLAWCAERGLDPLAAQRPHLELYIRWMQEIRRFKPSTVSRRFSVAAGSTGPASWTASCSTHRPTTSGAPPSRPNHPPSGSLTCSSRPCSPPPGSPRTPATSRWCHARPARLADLRSHQRGHRRPRRGTQPPGAAGMRQGHQGGPGPAAARGRPGHRPGSRLPAARELEARGRARATVTRRLSTIAGFYKYAVEEELLDRSPAAHVRRPRVDYESHAAALDRNELGALLVAAGLGLPPEHALISLLALNGLRISEAAGADIEHLGLERGHRTLTITRKISQGLRCQVVWFRRRGFAGGTRRLRRRGCGS